MEQQCPQCGKRYPANQDWCNWCNPNEPIIRAAITETRTEPIKVSGYESAILVGLLVGLLTLVSISGGARSIKDVWILSSKYWWACAASGTLLILFNLPDTISEKSPYHLHRVFLLALGRILVFVPALVGPGMVAVFFILVLGGAAAPVIYLLISVAISIWCISPLFGLAAPKKTEGIHDYRCKACGKITPKDYQDCIWCHEIFGNSEEVTDQEKVESDPASR